MVKILACAAAAASALLLPCAALAHAQLIGASPRVGSTVRASPAEIHLQFDDELDDWATSVELHAADGRGLPLGKAVLIGRPPTGVAVRLPAALPPGTYRVLWRASSSDGHQSKGDFRFTVRP